MLNINPQYLVNHKGEKPLLSCQCQSTAFLYSTLKTWKTF